MSFVLNLILVNFFVCSVAIAVTDPCQPSPCGPNSICKVINDSASCKCLPKYRGHPPNCQPECSNNSECPTDLACVRHKCKDPCELVCGAKTNCFVQRHLATCVRVYPIGSTIGHMSTLSDSKSISPCTPSLCGSNAICTEQDKVGSCACSEGYLGDPYEGCRPECVSNSDCPVNRTCINNKCRDPCPGSCGINTECKTENHSPICSCIPGYTGDPFIRCRLQVKTSGICLPSPCGPNSECREVNERAACSCLPNYNGEPPYCTTKCLSPSECAVRACDMQLTDYLNNSICTFCTEELSYDIRVLIASNLVTLVITAVVMGIVSTIYVKKFYRRRDQDNGTQEILEPVASLYEPVIYSECKSDAVATVDISKRAQLSIPEEDEDNKKYIHYDTPYDHRFDRRMIGGPRMNRQLH